MAKNIIASHSIDSIYLVSKEAGSAINNCKNQSAGPARFQIFLKMCDHHVDKGGGTTKPPAHSDLSKSPSHVKPDQTFAEVTQVTGSVSGGNTSSRTFEQILAEDLKDRNILEINLYKTNPEERGMNLTFDDLSTFIFDVLKIRHQDCVGIDYTTGRYDHREIQLKPGVDVSPYVTGNTPLLFRNHHILVKKQTNNVTKVLFRNVPLNVPDEEILNLCICYGEVLGGVTREKLNNKKDKGISGSNRAVEIILNENTSFENFYWLEGPQPGDQGRRVTVTHPGQPQQCSHCFSHDRPKYGKPLKDKCPAKGNGKACKEMEIKDRAKMADYMKELEELIGYVSLKNRYFRKLKIKPTKEPTDTDDSDKKTDEETEVSFGTRIINPIVEKDLQIEMLRKEQEKMPALIQELKNTRAILRTRRDEQNVNDSRLKLARKFAEQRMAEAIKSDTMFLTNNPHLISMLAVFQERDQFLVDPVTADIKPLNEDNFLKAIKDDVIKFSEEEENPPFNKLQYNERIDEVKNQVHEKMKEDKRFYPGTTTNSRRDSIAHSSYKRLSEHSLDGRSSSRPRRATGSGSSPPLPATQ